MQAPSQGLRSVLTPRSSGFDPGTTLAVCSKVKGDQNREQTRIRCLTRYHTDPEYRKDQIRKGAISRKAHRQRITQILVAAKDRPCADCVVSYPSYVMDFDHVRGEKLFTIGASLHRSEIQIRDEIEKCDVVCSNCHRKRTWGKTQG